jgi:putative flippase GtrA
VKSPGIVVSVADGLARQFVTFAGMGVIGTMAHYSILLAWVEWAGLASVTGSAIGFVAGALVNYALNYRFTFRSSASHRVALPKFMAVAIIGFCLNSLFMMAGTRWLSLHYLIVQMLATGAVLFLGFAANSLWTFGWKEHGHE